MNQGLEHPLHLVSLIFLFLFYEPLLSRIASGQFRTLDSLSLMQINEILRSAVGPIYRAHRRLCTLTNYSGHP